MYQNTDEWNKFFEDGGYIVLPLHAHLATRENGFHWFVSQYRAGLYNNKPYIHREDTLISNVEKPFSSDNFCEMAVDHINKEIYRKDPFLADEPMIIVSVYGLFITPDNELQLRYSILR